ncbi:MAG: ferritin-like domain-containing protein [Microthrixaceae bacterium]
MAAVDAAGSDAAGFEPHGLDEDEFYRRVQSFSFWFEAVEGYLADRPYGYDPATVDEPLEEPRRQAVITTLCNYCVGEAAALEASSGMVALAPNHNARIFMATQVADEARHLEVFLHRLRELGVEDPETEVAQRATPNIVAFKERLGQLVAAGDWEAAVLAQNVILETMEFTVFRHHSLTADPITKQVLDGVVADERRHLGFGENDLGRRLFEHPEHRPRLTELKHELDALVLGSFDATYSQLGLDASERPDLGRDYLAAVERLGLVS